MIPPQNQEPHSRSSLNSIKTTIIALVFIALLTSVGFLVGKGLHPGLDRLIPIAQSDGSETELQDKGTQTIHSSIDAISNCFLNGGKCAFDYEFGPIPNVFLLDRKRSTTTKGKWDLGKKRKEKSTHLNVLYFGNRNDYLTKTDRYFYDEIKAASSHPQISVRLWGPGWAMYNEKISARENILRAFPNIQFDIIYTKTRHYNVTSPTAVVVHGTADCHQHACLNPEVYPSHADAITYRYAGLIMEFSRPNQWKSHESKRVKKMYQNLNETERHSLIQPMPFFFHSPDCADEEILHPIPSTQRQQQTWAESRPVSIRLIGNHRKELYPLRYKIWNAIKSGKIQNAVIYQHVGNTINTNDNTKEKQKSETTSVEGWNNASTGPGNSLGVFDPHDPDVAHHRKNQQDWARVLATTQICVFDSSIVRKAVRKFQESFMSGCVVASDIPLEMEDLFKDVVIPLNVKMSVDQINSILQEYLQDKAKLEWMAREAFKRARMHWTCRNKVDRLMQAAARVLEGERGYWFPFGYSATCRKFWTEAKYETEWCQANDPK